MKYNKYYTFSCKYKQFRVEFGLSFINFSCREVNLKYLNIILIIKCKDMYFINSKLIYHNVFCSFRNKQILVCTNHKSVLTRFYEIQICIKTYINKKQEKYNICVFLDNINIFLGNISEVNFNINIILNYTNIIFWYTSIS